MAECDSGQQSLSAYGGAQEQGGACSPLTFAEATQPVDHVALGGTDFETLIKHKKHQNGLVTHLLKTTDDTDNGESADSGHGSSCQECECASTLSQLIIESEITCLSLSDDPSADPATCHHNTDLSPESGREENSGIRYVVYESEEQMPDIIRLITKDLSEPYSIYTYRYFIHNWPKLCFLAMDGDKCVGAIVCKLDMHKKMVRRGYIAMLAVDADYRRKKLGSSLVTKAIRAMIADDCDEVVLETEITNKAALRLYENLGFIRDKRLFRYYLNGVDALRLKLWLR
ncbi:N-alpha-acetyltransferase 30-like [Pomacea canaliculata]|uniref:N-alpha-acetyltransferase 30-like n=1 Tax=Pomacea canaliculata TaxID=400727 RepID=UPI000D72A130|nr:N-alpha-acetyltransferase 30-like [Pomacea canaliculata]